MAKVKRDIVFRLEHSEDKTGPYNKQYSREFPDVVCEMREAHAIGCESTHPNWLWDGIMAKKTFEDTSLDSYLAGCKTEKQLRDWFGEFFEPLLTVGFVVKKYKTKHVIEGRSGKQIAFLPVSQS